MIQNKNGFINQQETRVFSTLCVSTLCHQAWTEMLQPAGPRIKKKTQIFSEVYTAPKRQQWSGPMVVSLTSGYSCREEKKMQRKHHR